MIYTCDIKMQYEEWDREDKGLTIRETKVKYYKSPSTTESLQYHETKL